VHGPATRVPPLPAAARLRLATSGGGTAATAARDMSDEAGPPDPWRLGPTARRQSTFGGSDRQGRGRLLDALRYAEVDDQDLAAASGWPAEPGRARRVAAALVEEGFAEWSGGRRRFLRLR
jgi:hypothetical protein